MASFANSLASNVEASLSFTLATSLVDAMLSLNQKPWVLASLLFIVLSVFKNGENIIAQVLLLALSRLFVYQVINNSKSAPVMCMRAQCCDQKKINADQLHSSIVI